MSDTKVKVTKEIYNPKGYRPQTTCKYCHKYWDDKKDGDWTGIPIENVVLKCGFCKDDGQDW